MLAGKPPILPRGRTTTNAEDNSAPNFTKKRASSALPKGQSQPEESFKYLDPDEDHLGAN